MIIEEQATLTAIWLGALRSGEYEQGGGAMCRLDSDGQPQYCCLGVADEACFGASFTPAYGDICRDDIGLFATLPFERARLLGLDVLITEEELDSASSLDCPLFVTACDGYDGGSLTRMRLLTLLNDSDKSFEEIADFIEEHGWLA